MLMGMAMLQLFKVMKNERELGKEATSVNSEQRDASIQGREVKVLKKQFLNSLGKKVGGRLKVCFRWNTSVVTKQEG